LTLDRIDSTRQDDWESFIKFTPGVTKELQVVGDDLTVTNPKKIKEAAEKGWVLVRCVRTVLSTIL